MGPRTLVWMALVALGGSLFTACSDDAEALSKPDFIEQADAICQEATDDLDPIWEEFYASWADADWDEPGLQDELIAGFAGVFDEARPRWEQQVDELRELAPPADDAELLESMLDDLEAALEEMDEILTAAVAGDEAARERMDSDDDPMADVNRGAREYGLAVCGSEE